MTNKRWRPIELAASVTILCTLAAAVFVFFTVRVCDEQLTQGGGVVLVCRHLQAADPPVIVLGLIVLVALGVFFTEVSGFGVSLKRQVKAATETAETAKEIAKGAKEDAGDLAEGVGQALSRTRNTAVNGRSEEDSSDMADLADRYNNIRWTMPSGPERTAAMEAVVKEMMLELENVEDFDVLAHLGSENRGLRLAGYAYLYAYPDPEKAANLVSALLSEDKPFGQYWALRALSRIVDRDPNSLDTHTRRRLVSLQADVGRNSDRGRLLEGLLHRTEAWRSP